MLSEFVDWIGFILGRHLIKSQLGLTRLRLPTTNMEESCSVFWREFPDHLKLLFLELYRTESHADVTLLSTDEVKFQAHKVVLSACSPVLKKVIDSRPPGEALVYQTGIESPELESILHLMYVGEGKFYEERRGGVVRAATELEIEQISDNDVTWHSFSGHLRTLLQDLYRTGVYEYKATEKRILRLHIQSVYEKRIHKCNLCEHIHINFEFEKYETATHRALLTM